jgi:hypothetical protein
MSRCGAAVPPRRRDAAARRADRPCRRAARGQGHLLQVCGHGAGRGGRGARPAQGAIAGPGTHAALAPPPPAASARCRGSGVAGRAGLGGVQHWIRGRGRRPRRAAARRPRRTPRHHQPASPASPLPGPQEDDCIGVLPGSEKIAQLKPLGDRILIKVRRRRCGSCVAQPAEQPAQQQHARPCAKRDRLAAPAARGARPGRLLMPARPPPAPAERQARGPDRWRRAAGQRQRGQAHLWRGGGRG